MKSIKRLWWRLTTVEKYYGCPHCPKFKCNNTKEVLEHQKKKGCNKGLSFRFTKNKSWRVK